MSKFLACGAKKKKRAESKQFGVLSGVRDSKMTYVAVVGGHNRNPEGGPARLRLFVCCFKGGLLYKECLGLLSDFFSPAMDI